MHLRVLLGLGEMKSGVEGQSAPEKKNLDSWYDSRVRGLIFEEGGALRGLEAGSQVPYAET